MAPCPSRVDDLPGTRENPSFREVAARASRPVFEEVPTPGNPFADACLRTETSDGYSAARTRGSSPLSEQF